MLISRCLEGSQLNPCQPLYTDYLLSERNAVCRTIKPDYVVRKVQKRAKCIFVWTKNTCFVLCETFN